MKYSEEFLEDIAKQNSLTLLRLYEKKKYKRFVDLKCNLCGKTFTKGIDKWMTHKKCSCSLQKKVDNNFNARKNEFILYITEHQPEYEYISGFVNHQTKVNILHKPCGNIYAVTPNHFKNGRGCPICNGGVSYSNDTYLEKFYKTHDKQEYVVMSKYKNSNTEITIKHISCGLEYTVKHPTALLNGAVCPYCSGVRLKPISFIKTQVFNEDPNYELADDLYSNSIVNLKHLSCGTVYEAFLPNFLSKHIARCPKCYHQSSKAELEIQNFVNSLGLSAKKIRKKINGKIYELDVFIEDLNIGIEYDGLYWHSELFHTNRQMFNKIKAFESLGIRVINIFEDEWLTKKDIVCDKLKSILQCNDSKKLYARNCTVKDISAKDRNNFLSLYHIQGADKATISKGLFYNNELVGVMSFSQLRSCLGNKATAGKYELSRFATKYQIPGGFSKLFKTIIREHSEIQSVITYADLRWSSKQSNVYINSGLFTLDHISPPSYYYFLLPDKRLFRYNFQKAKLQKLFPNEYDINLSEKQIMDKTKYKRIWDAGNLVYIWKP